MPQIVENYLPMHTRLGLLIALACLGLACSSDKGGQQQAATSATDQPASTAPGGEAAAAAGEQKTDDTQKPSAAETPVPKKTIKLDKLGSGKPLEIDVPTDFAIERATPDFVILQGSFKLMIEIPAEGLVGLDDEHAMVASGKAELVLEEKFEDGDAISYRADGKTYTTVSRPRLGVLCSTETVTSAGDVRKVFEICKTLRRNQTP